MQNCACEVDECALCGAEFYSALTAEQVCQIRELLVKKTCKPRTVLFRQGESDSLLFMLRRGLVSEGHALVGFVRDLVDVTELGWRWRMREFLRRPEFAALRQQLDAYRMDFNTPQTLPFDKRFQRRQKFIKCKNIV